MGQGFGVIQELELAQQRLEASCELPEDDPKQRRPDIRAMQPSLTGAQTLPLKSDCRRRSPISKGFLAKKLLR